jgi:hypothetical protein
VAFSSCVPTYATVLRAGIVEYLSIKFVVSFCFIWSSCVLLLPSIGTVSLATHVSLAKLRSLLNALHLLPVFEK